MSIGIVTVNVTPGSYVCLQVILPELTEHDEMRVSPTLVTDDCALFS